MHIRLCVDPVIPSRQKTKKADVLDKIDWFVCCSPKKSFCM